MSKTGIDELANSIDKDGLLQNLSVEKVGTKFEVVAGGRRLAALKQLSKKKKIPASFPVPCKVIATGEAEAVSLAENQLREAMHPVDQLFAFTNRINAGDDIAEVSARFGVTESFVKQRLKLSTVAPELLEECREGKINLQALQALSVTDDHEKQKEVWDQFKNDDPRYYEADDIKSSIMHESIKTNDPRLKFVGKAAYKKAGGVVINADLFSEDGIETISDEDLLDQLVETKLTKKAEKLMKDEGLAFVEKIPGQFYLHDQFELIEATTVKRNPNKAEASAIKKIEDEIEAQSKLQDKASDEEDESTYDAIEENIWELRQKIDDLEELLEEPHPDELEHMGAVISIDFDGKLDIRRNLIPKKHKAKVATKTSSSKENPSDEPEDDSYSDKLTLRLTAHKTAIIRNKVAQNKVDALAIIVFHMLAEDYDQFGCLTINSRHSKSLNEVDETINNNNAFKELISAKENFLNDFREVLEAGDEKQLFNVLVALDIEKLMTLLAFCVANRVDLVSTNHLHQESGIVAEHLLSDPLISTYWKPTQENFFNHISKPKIISVVEKALPEQDTSELSAMKKR